MAEKIEKDQSVGVRLLELRNKNSLTQEDLAERLEVSRQSISKWELNKTLPDVDKLIQLSEIYQVSIDFLIKGKKAEADTEILNDTLPEKEWEENKVVEGKIAGSNIENTVRQFVILICIFLSGLLCLCMIFVTGRLILNHTFQRENKEQDVIQVEKIYEQYTKAQVSRWSSENKAFLSEIVWLDIPGVREDDYVFCYLDGEKADKVSFEYYTKTLLLPVVAGLIFLIFFIVFLIELKGLVRKERNDGEQRGEKNAKKE